MAKKIIRNPQKWIGKYVRHMANWQDFQWLKTTDDNATDDYFVDEWNGRLYRACDQGYYGDVFDTKEEAEAAGFDECYYYSHEGLYEMRLAAKSTFASSDELNAAPAPADFIAPLPSEDIITVESTVVVPALPIYGTVYGEVVEVDFESQYPYRVKFYLPYKYGTGGWEVRQYSAQELSKVAV